MDVSIPKIPVTGKIVALGDIHGRSSWQQIINHQVFDKLVLIGDYFDKKEEVTPEVQIDNFEAICSYKRSHPDKMILLIGNHDYHYLDITIEKYTGYQADYADVIRPLVEQAIEDGLMQMSFQYEMLLFTHAGVTKTWARGNDIHTLNIQKSINELFKNHPERFGYLQSTHQVGNQMPDGCSPIWVRPDKLIHDKIDNYIQVVGHTQQERLTMAENLYFIDTLGSSKEYLIIEDGEILVRQL
jgi:predicted MPP superfamily phosphohydrolase